MPEYHKEFRLIVERTIPGDSRVMRDELPLKCEEDARRLAAYWKDLSGRSSGHNGWVEVRELTLWENL